MSRRLYVVPGSHAALAAQLMLDHKGLDYRRRDLVAVVHKPVLRALRFPAATVPALRENGQRIQGTREIARHLDALQPDPPLLPVDPARRAAVEEAEAWGDEVLQSVPRRLSWWALGRDRSTARGHLEGARLGIPTSVAAATAGPIIWAASRLNSADDGAVRRDLAELPALLDTADGYVLDGVIGGEEPNAADFQIAPSIALLMKQDSLRPALSRRPVAGVVERLIPESLFPGTFAPVIPEDWLPAELHGT